jgi:hypothetical protein
MRILTLKIVGDSPLLMHSARYSNPLDPLTKQHKALTGKRKKTDDDQEAILRSEWMGALYLMKKGKSSIVGMQGANLDSSFFEGAKLDKNGTLYKRAVQVYEDVVPLEYDGPKDIEKLYEAGSFADIRGVKVGTARVMRCRPIFSEWALQCTVMIDETMFDVADFVRAATRAGRYIGIGDFRPGKRGTCGKFSVEVVSDVEDTEGAAIGAEDAVEA